MRILFLLLAALFSSCSRHMLEVRSQYLHPDLLASEQVNTPDPCRACFQGQEVIVRWRVPRDLFCDDLMLIFTFRDGNREIEEVKVPLKSSCGFWAYRLLGAAYWRRGGILSYRVDLCGKGQLLYTWKHHVWAEIINIH